MRLPHLPRLRRLQPAQCLQHHRLQVHRRRRPVPRRLKVTDGVVADRAAVAVPAVDVPAVVEADPVAVVAAAAARRHRHAV